MGDMTSSFRGLAACALAALAACNAPDSQAWHDGQRSPEPELVPDVASDVAPGVRAPEATARPALAISAERPRGDEPWRAVLAERVGIFGHRNVIAVVDAAFPALASPGIETVATHASQDEVLDAVLAAIAGTGHLRPHALIARELDFLPEASAPGIGAFREALLKRLGEPAPERVAHEDLVERVSHASATFRVLILKTELARPYSCVFLQLEPSHWTEEAERQLRAASERKAEEPAPAPKSDGGPPDKN